MNRQFAIFALAALVAGSAVAQDRGRWDGNRGDGGRSDAARMDHGNDAPRQDGRPAQRQPQVQSAPAMTRSQTAPPANPQAREPDTRAFRGQDSWRQQYQYGGATGQAVQPPVQSQSSAATPFRGDAGRQDNRRPDAGGQVYGRPDWGRQEPPRRDVGRPETGRSDPRRTEAGRSDWGRSDWSRKYGGRQNWDDRGGDHRESGRNGRTWRYHGEDRDSYRVSAFRYPHGWGYRSWRIGERLPFLFLTSYYFLDEYDYDLPPAPYGYRWVRYGSDALLVNIYTGEVDDVIYGIFYW